MGKKDKYEKTGACGDIDGRCLECKELSKKKKYCLKCDKEFNPGCRSRFLCLGCFSTNQRVSLNMFYPVIKPDKERYSEM